MTLHPRDIASIALVAVVLAGCASSISHAPISDRHAKEQKSGTPPVTASTRQAPGEQDWRPQVYVVQKGDTLYGIAFNYGMDYHELAELNNIQNPDVIKAGQELRLFGPNNVLPVTPAPPPEIQTQPLAKPVADGKPAEQAKPGGIPVISQPLAVTLAYSAGTAEQVTKVQGGVPRPTPALPARTVPPPQTQTPTASPPVATPAPDINDDAIEWGMPTNGKIISGFSEGENQKGIDVAGKIGQPVLASAAGKVVYSGSGLRGYGKLIIIKHNKTFLSAYAHNDRILVKEGQVVTKGQKIAEMGDSDANQAALHFEIRKLGKPVDPAKYLPLIKS